MRLSLPTTLGLALAVLIIGGLPLYDPDFFWHVKTGEIILQTKSLPAVDIFSYTTDAAPWVIQGWLFDAILSAVWSSYGLNGIRVLVAILAVLIWGITYRSARLYVHRIGPALIVSGLTILTLLPTLAPRYTLISALCISWILHTLLVFKKNGEIKLLFTLPAVFAIWSNCHFGFPIGFFLIGLFVVCEALDLRHPLKAGEKPRRTFLKPAPLLTFLACAISIGLNPYGYGIAQEIIKTFITVSNASITEWQSPSFSTLTGKLYALIAALFFFTSLARKENKEWADLIIPLAFIAIGFTAMRHISIMGIIICAFFAKNLESSISTDPKNSQPYQAKEKARPTRKELSPRLETLFNTLLIICVTILTLTGSELAQKNFDRFKRVILPIAATDFIESQNLKGKLFNTFNGGGYLIYRLYPTFKVFIDNRYHVYPYAVVDDWKTITNGEPGWFATLEKYEPEILVCETWSSFRQLLLLRPEFRLVYEDRYFSVLVRKLDRFASLKTVKPQLDLPSIMH